MRRKKKKVKKPTIHWIKVIKTPNKPTVYEIGYDRTIRRFTEPTETIIKFINAHKEKYTDFNTAVSTVRRYEI